MEHGAWSTLSGLCDHASNTLVSEACETLQAYRTDVASLLRILRRRVDPPLSLTLITIPFAIRTLRSEGRLEAKWSGSQVTHEMQAAEPVCLWRLEELLPVPTSA